MKRADPLKPDDTKILELPPELVVQYNDLSLQLEELAALTAKMLRMQATAMANRTLLWDAIMALNERCETANSRNKTLSIREENGRLVVAETNEHKLKGSDLMQEP